ncbi:MAG: hypothetical protein ACREJO_13370 [Phycisphaerales bacterium]
MTFAFPAFHEERIEAPAELTVGDVLAALAAIGLSGSASADGATVRSSSGLNMWSWSEKLIVERAGPTTLRVRSECALSTQCVDWGKNARNVRKIIAAIRAVRVGVVAMPPASASPSR